MYNLIVTGNHAAHISLAAKFLKIDHILVATPSIWDESWDKAYEKTMNILAEWAYEYMDVCLWKWYLETQIIYGESDPEYINLYVMSADTLEESVLNLASTMNLHNWLKTSHHNREAIRTTCLIVLGREPVDEEVEYWNEWTARDYSKRIDLFSWLLFLHFSLEGKRVKAHMEYVRLFKNAKYSLPIKYPITAVIMSGHSKDFWKHVDSHRVFIDNIYVDIFMHIWRKKGPRSYTGESGTGFINEDADINVIKNEYSPLKIVIEDLEIHRAEFSLIDDMSLLFFTMNQQKDDASFYENADLYSLYNASLLVKDYEIEHGFQYTGLIKMSFIMKVDKFDYKGISENMVRDIFWVPENGCRLCNREYNWPLLYEEKGHSSHTNDINVYWMYGKRNIMMFACELYLHAFSFAQSMEDDNMKNYLLSAKYKKFRDFVYIDNDPNDICTKVQGFYKQNLYRDYMKNYFCVTSGNIKGHFNKFDVDRNAFGT
jgi:hypothetical protein